MSFTDDLRERREYLAADAIDELRELCKELAEALRIYHGCSYPVSTEINPKGYAWVNAYLDQAKPIGENALLKYRRFIEPTKNKK